MEHPQNNLLEVEVGNNYENLPLGYYTTQGLSQVQEEKKETKSILLMNAVELSQYLNA